MRSPHLNLTVTSWSQNYPILVLSVFHSTESGPPKRGYDSRTRRHPALWLEIHFLLASKRQKCYPWRQLNAKRNVGKHADTLNLDAGEKQGSGASELIITIPDWNVIQADDPAIGRRHNMPISTPEDWTRTRTRTYTNPYDTKTDAAG